MTTDPVQAPNDAVRAQARELIDTATQAALAFVTADGAPSVSRIALATDAKGLPLSLVSLLSAHTRSLELNPRCALLIGAPGDKGDPLTHPRLTLHCIAGIISHNSEAYGPLRQRYLDLRPKAKLYIDFADFHLVTFTVQDGLWNGGFGKAHRLAASDLG